MARFTAAALALAFFTGSASADCFDKCNQTYVSCQNNPLIDKEYCEMGMENCVLKCFNQLDANQTDVWASNCTDRIPYLRYLENSTANWEMTKCMEKAFQQKRGSDWSPWQCSYQCDDASSLCNLIQYIDYSQCQNRTDTCYTDCFNYDFDNHTNNTNCTWQTVCTEYYWGGQCANYQQMYICNDNYSYCFWQQQCMEMNMYGGCLDFQWQYQCPGNTTNCSWVESCNQYSWNGSCLNSTYKWDCSQKNDTNNTSNCTWQNICAANFDGVCRQYEYIQNCTNCSTYEYCSWWNNGTCQYWDVAKSCNTTNLTCQNAWSCGQWDWYGNCTKYGWWYNCSVYDPNPPVPPQNCSWENVCTSYSWNGNCANYTWEYICNGNYSNCSYREHCTSWDYMGYCNNSYWQWDCNNQTNNTCNWVSECESWFYNGTCAHSFTYWDCNNKDAPITNSNCTNNYLCIDYFNGICRHYDFVQNCTNTTYSYQCKEWNYSNNTCALYDLIVNQTQTEPLNCTNQWGCGQWDWNGNCTEYGYWYNCSQYQPPVPPQNCSWESVCNAYSWNGSCVNHTWEYICNGNYSNCYYREQCTQSDQWGNCNNSYWVWECNNQTNNSCAWVVQCSQWDMYGNCVSNYSQWDCSDKTQNRTDSYCGWNNVCIASFEGNCTKWDYVQNCTNTTYWFTCTHFNWQNNSCMIYYLNKDVVSTPSLNCSNQYGCGRWDSWGNCQQSGWWYNCSEPYVPPVQNCSWQYVCNVFSWNSSCLSQEWQYVCNGNYSNCSEQCYSWDYWGNCNSSSWYGNCNFTNNSCADTKICTGYSWNGTCDSFYYEWNCQDKQNSWTDSYCYDQNVCVDNFNGECRRYEYVRNCSNTTYYFRCLQANYSQCSLYEREFNTTYNDPLDCNSSYGCGNWSSDGSCMSWGYWTNCSFPAPPQDCHWEWLCSAFSWNGSCVNYTQEYICNGQYPNCTWREQCFSWDYWGNCNSSSWYQDCNHNVTNDTCAWVEECSLSQWGSCVNYTRYWDCSSKDSWSDYHCYDDYQCLSEFAQSCRQWGYQTNCTNTTIDYSCIQWNNNNTCGVYARINTTTYTLPLNCSMDWGCGVWNWEGSCAQYGYWRNCSLPGPTQNCTWEDVCVSYYSNGTCYGYRQEYICNGNYTNCTQNQTCVQYDQFWNTCQDYVWFDTCQSYNCTWVQNCIVRNYTGECLNYTNNYLCQPMDNHTCKSTETCSAFTFDGRCINTTYRDVCDGNYTGLCSDRQVCDNLTPAGMCLAYHTTVNCVNQTNQCATVREYQGLTYNGTANYSYTWDCDFKWYHEDKSCRDDYQCIATYNGTCQQGGIFTNCTSTSWYYSYIGTLPYSSTPLYDKIVSQNVTAPLDCSDQWGCGRWDWYGNCLEYGYWHNCTNNATQNDTNCGLVTACSWRDRNGMCQTWYNTTRCGLNETHYNSTCDYNEVCTATFSNQFCGDWEYLYNCTNSTVSYYCVDYNSTGCKHWYENATYSFTPLACNETAGCGNWSSNGVCQNWGYWVNCTSDLNGPEPQRCDWSSQCTQWSMNGSCLNNSYVQNCTQPKADGCQWDERCVSWNYMNCTQVSYYQNCLNNMTKPTVESQVKRSKMRAFTLNPSDRRPVQVVAQEPNCAPCFNMGVRVKDLIEQHNCNFIFETYMQTLAEEFFPSEQASGEIAAKFVSNCAHLREHVEKGTYTPQYACQRASAC